MFELRGTDALSLQVKPNTLFEKEDRIKSYFKDKKLIYIIGVIVVFIAAFMMFFVIKNYVTKINSFSDECNKKCNGAEPCVTACGLKNTVASTVNVILIFVFIMIILGTYFVLAQTIPS